jgi:hypothetical protein
VILLSCLLFDIRSAAAAAPCFNAALHLDVSQSRLEHAPLICKVPLRLLQSL